MQVVTPHNYWPPDIEIPNYVSNEWATEKILATFGGLVGVLLGATLTLTKLIRPDLSRSDVLAVLWHVLSGGLHLFFESYYILHFRSLAGEQSLLAQLWKEYALSDSRYLTQDLDLFCIELLTVLIYGPLSLTIAHAILTSHPRRYPLQLILATAHLVSVSVYFSTSIAQVILRGALPHTRPEPLYSLLYFWGFNLPWALVPALLIRQAVRECVRAVEGMRTGERERKGR